MNILNDTYWSLGHAEQNNMQHATLKMALVDPRDMLNNFYFHVYAHTSLIVGENVNGGFFVSNHTLSCEWINHRAGSQLKNNNNSSKMVIFVQDKTFSYPWMFY